MGITNFTKLFHVLDEDEQWNEPFDSILVDVQSFVYVAIDQCFPQDENVQDHEVRFFRDVSSHVQKRLADVVLDVFKRLSPVSNEEVAVVFSFDGRGVPMKWPTQRSRRCGVAQLGGKNLYRMSLLGSNVLSLKLRDDLVESLETARFHERHLKGKKRLTSRYLRYVVAGCDVEGEGEHKMFHVAEALGFESPVVVSGDNDVFVLGLARIRRFRCLQLCRPESRRRGNEEKKKIYNLTHFANESLKFPADALVLGSFLFGNDFVPPVVGITDTNHCTVATALIDAWEKRLENVSSATSSASREERVAWMPDLYFYFLREMDSHLRYERCTNRTPEDVETAAVRFWINCLWTVDYYERRDFPQKWAENRVFGADDFDRNVLLVALTDQKLSRETFRKAFELYESNSIPSVERAGELTDRETAERVFDKETLRVVSRFLSSPDRNGPGSCYDIKLSTSKRKRT